jgi:hypothetical protein
MSTFDKLDETFNTESTEELPIETKVEEENLPVVASEDLPEKELEDDYQAARQTLKDAESFTKEAIQGMMKVAKNSDQPRAWEVTGQLIKTLQDNAGAMMEVQEKKKKVTGVTPATPNKVTNNILMAGTTKELLDALNKKDGPVTIDHE